MNRAPEVDATQAPPLEIAHVLFLDIVAYSRLRMNQQQRIIRDLQDSVRATAEFARAQNLDQLILLPTGDGMALVFFRDPEAPVRCALELTKILRERPEIQLRMGLHTGPVYRIADINANRNVAGGGINIAQRVMDCGDAGHILVSKAMADVLRELSSWNEQLRDLGEAEVKHSVRVHLFNLCAGEAGNPALPQKLRAAQTAKAPALKDSGSATSKRRFIAGTVTAVVILSVVATVFFLRTPKVHALTEKDTVVLADFDNSTNDPVFDDTMKEALTVEIEQSPFFNTLSEQKIRETLQLMGQPADQRLTKDLARQVCIRAGCKAILDGRISKGDTEYVVALSASNCTSGESLARGLTRAANKDAILDALGKNADALRSKLGESLTSIRKYDTPLEQATTPSLDALNAFTLATKMQREKGDAASIVHYKRAIDLDSNFALAYSGLATAYSHLGLVNAAGENARKAYDLRGHVSEREKLRIAAFYHTYVTGNVSEAINAYELWSQSYPRDSLPHAGLANLFGALGQYDKGIAESRTALDLDPDASVNYSDLAGNYSALGQRPQAKQVLDQASQKVDSTVLRLTRYQFAFLEHDSATMAAQVAWAAHKPGEGLLLSADSDTAAYFGRLRKARALSQRAAEASDRSDMAESTAVWEGNAALREADFGNREAAIRGAEAAAARSNGKQVWALAALTFARAGDAARAERLAQKLQQNYPDDTLLRYYWLPVVRASLALNRGDGKAAIALLQDAAPYDLASPFPVTASPIGNMYSVYLRGLAYLQAGDANAAAAEFRKVVEQKGVVMNGWVGPLSQAELARALAQQGDTAKARSAYEDFFALWKDADPDIPILKQFRADSATLH
ncbi:MAG TPA: tetratricopeptide repeat protein [Candidatus Acidoferrum sp.]|nr:tetratricopeptide repeat protein [Candidatus Acidoferrum sp.]